MTNELAPFLQQVYDQVTQKHAAEHDEILDKNWRVFTESIQKQHPEISYDENTRLLTMGNISPGCVLCRMGKWDCYFITPHCNLDCDFCYSQKRSSDHFTGSNLGEQLQENFKQYQQLGIHGLSFSGGEALLKKQAVYQWLEQASQITTLEHIWLYTNGLILDEATIRDLSRLGLDEIRFNAAASGYQNQHVLEMIEKAAQHLDWVTIEIPLIPEDEAILLSSIKLWFERGIRVLNIHELLYEPGSNAENLPGEKQPVSLPDGHRTAISPFSAELAKKVFQTVKTLNIPLGVNYCSTAGKWQQLTARRETLLPFTQEKNEYYLGNGMLESYYKSDGHGVRILSLEELKTLNRENRAKKVYRLVRMAPLSTNESRKNWLKFEVLL